MNIGTKMCRHVCLAIVWNSSRKKFSSVKFYSPILHRVIMCSKCSFNKVEDMINSLLFFRLSTRVYCIPGFGLSSSIKGRFSFGVEISTSLMLLSHLLMRGDIQLKWSDCGPNQFFQFAITVEDHLLRGVEWILEDACAERLEITEFLNATFPSETNFNSL